MVDLKLNERYAERIFDMKKFTGLVFALIMLCSVASAEEILFRGIPWGTNIPDACKLLSDFEIIDYIDELPAQEWMESYTGEGLDNSFNILAHANDGVTVGGYEINLLDLLFLYSFDEAMIHREQEESRLFRATYHLTVADAESAFADLTMKLTTLYGEGTQSQSDGERYVEWRSEGTGVYLIMGDSYINITYGVTDDSWLNDLNAAIAKEEQQNAVDNMDGL